MPSSSIYLMKILRSMLSILKLRLLKKMITFWFHKLLNCLSLWIFLNICITNSAQIDLKAFISRGSFMKIGKFLSVRKLLRYASIISTNFMIKFNKYNIAKNILNNSLHNWWEYFIIIDFVNLGKTLHH